MSSPLIAFVAGYSPGIPALAGFWKLRQLTREGRIMLFLVVLAFITDLLNVWLRDHGFRTIAVSHVYNLIEYVCLASVLAAWTGRIMAKTLRWSIPVFAVVWLAMRLFADSFQDFDVYTRPAGRILLLTGAVAVLHRVSLDIDIVLWRDFRFLVTTGMTLYCGGGLLIFSLSDWLVTLPIEEFTMVYHLQWWSSIISNLIYTGAFLWGQPPHPSSGLSSSAV